MHFTLEKKKTFPFLIEQVIEIKNGRACVCVTTSSIFFLHSICLLFFSFSISSRFGFTLALASGKIASNRWLAITCAWFASDFVMYIYLFLHIHCLPLVFHVFHSFACNLSIGHIQARKKAQEKGTKKKHRTNQMQKVNVLNENECLRMCVPFGHSQCAYRQKAHKQLSSWPSTVDASD